MTKERKNRLTWHLIKNWSIKDATILCECGVLTDDEEGRLQHLKDMRDDPIPEGWTKPRLPFQVPIRRSNNRVLEPEDAAVFDLVED